MKVTACVVSWNMADHLAGALDSLVAQNHPDLEIVVVDNASRDGSHEIVAGYDGVRLIANPDNRGFAGAANQGLARGAADGAEAFLVCNPDVQLAPDYVAQAVAALAAAPRRAAVQGKLLRGTVGALPPADGVPLIDTTGHVAFATRLFRNRGENLPDDGRYDAAGPVFGVSGACALYRVAALHDVAVEGEVFDTDLFAYWEDVDLDWRLQLRGWEAHYTPAAVARHQRGGAGPRRSPAVERLNFANRFLVVLKNDDGRALARALPGVALTTALKAGELVLTVPSAFLRSFAAVTQVPRILAKRRVVHARATVAPAAVVQRWFGPFDYGAWCTEYVRRVRRERAGAA